MRTSQSSSTQNKLQQGKLQLSAGQTYRFHAEQGTALLALTGNLRVTEAPQWFGDAMLAPQQTVVEGQQHIVERGGWVSISADRAASIAVVANEVASGPSLKTMLDTLRKAAHRVSYKTSNLFAR